MDALTREAADDCARFFNTEYPAGLNRLNAEQPEIGLEGPWLAERLALDELAIKELTRLVALLLAGQGK